MASKGDCLPSLLLVGLARSPRCRCTVESSKHAAIAFIGSSRSQHSVAARSNFRTPQYPFDSLDVSLTRALASVQIVDPEVEYLTPVVKKGGAGKEKKFLVKYYTDAN